MPYYRGDYYRGDYYRGDPGIFSDIGHFLGGAAKAAVGFATGGIGGLISSAVPQIFHVNRQPAATPILPPGLSGPLAASGVVQVGTGMVNINSARGMFGASAMPGGALPMGPGGMGFQTGGGTAMVPFGGRRQHPNRSTYVTRGGGTSRWPQGLELHPAGSTLVTSRRMNVGNARALRRALRRARGFAKLAHKVLAATRHFKGRGFGRARARRR